MEVGFRLVDAFTETPFQGNRLCVVPETPDGFSTEQMKMLALETNFSETTFVIESRADGYRMRIFTPDAELPFAGHPTIGTAYTLASEGRTSPETVQTTALGDIPIEVDLGSGFVWMTQRQPMFGPEFHDRSVVAEAAGLEPDDLHPDLPMQVISTGLGPLIVPIRDEGTLRRAERHEPSCRRATSASGGECHYLFAVRGDRDVIARMFDASLGVGEDPATGSAAGPLGVYLASRGLAGMPGDAVIAQGEMVGRRSFLHLDVRPDGDSWNVRVGGGVRIVGEGVFRLPD
ncbi:MAG TPA: PhzF family phenazine biosynthesis protein [Actinomycetota bacterium]|nr:PhzF family phenazine biosynthesis protein [Actinomycetota bacterium]